MATATELGLTKPNKHGVLVLKTLSGTVEVFDRFVPTGTGAAKGSGTAACARICARQELGDGLGCAAGGPFAGS
jgi:hypothetical protein